MGDVDFKALQEVFGADELEWRLQQAGEKNGRIWALAVAYVTNRAIQQRLDDVVGPANWRNQFRPGPGGGVLCGLSLRVGGEWVTKWDGAENTDIEGVKGGLSGAMKRAAVQWGIGRYLYALEETFAVVGERGKHFGKTKQGSEFRWDPPALPLWALPQARPPEPARAPLRAEPATAPAAAAPAAEQPPGGAEGPERSEHAAMLQFVRQVGPSVDDAAEIRINRKVRNLKDFVRENWPTIKEEPKVARAVVDAIQSATGTAFEVERAA